RAAQAASPPARRRLRTRSLSSPQPTGSPFARAGHHPVGVSVRAPIMSGSDGPHATIQLALRMITRAAVLERIGAPLVVAELELDAPGPGEVLVELQASGVCHSDLNAIDGTAPTPCPAVLGHEGGGVVRPLGSGVSRVSV